MSAPSDEGGVIGLEVTSTPVDDVPDWLKYHRSERVTEYDSSKYDWNSLLTDLLHTPEWASSNRPIHVIHKTRDGETNGLPAEPPRWRKLTHAFRHAGWKMPPAWAKALRPGEEKRSFTLLQKETYYLNFLEAYKAFVTNEIAPTCGDPNGVVFQSPPTIRVAMPSKAPTIQLHCDSQYDRHQSGEINFWVPVGKVFGFNCLRVESKPNAADYIPIELTEHEYLRFDGYNCRHFTVPNDTDYTRISFDFRVVPVSLYKEFTSANKRKSGKIGDYKTMRTGPVKLRDFDQSKDKVIRLANGSRGDIKGN